MSTIELKGVSRLFGNVVAVNDVTMTIGPGVTGLLGPNGAGKSTLLGMMSGFLPPSSGTVTIDGVEVWRNPAMYSDIGLVPATGGSSPWWTALEGDDAPKIIARLPFVERADHPAGLPVFGIARPNPDAIVTDVETWSIRVSGWGPAVARSLDPSTEVIAVPDSAFDGAALLVSVPQGRVDVLAGLLVNAGASVRSKALVGSHARRYTVTAEGARPVGR